MPIGVSGIVKNLPLDFPLSYTENAGNMIHGHAPFDMFREAHLALDRSWPGWTEGAKFRDWVNDSCSHVIITAANLFRSGDHSEGMRARYKKFIQTLEGYNKPIVIFGLGSQAPSLDINRASFPSEAIQAMQVLSEKTEVIGVRGNFTAEIFKKFAGVENTYVTGCPSLFAVPESLSRLRENANILKSKPNPRVSYSGTYFHRAYELTLLRKAIQSEYFLIEPMNKEHHRLHLDALSNPEVAEVPEHLRPLLAGGVPELTRKTLVEFFSRRHKLFRDVPEWRRFNREYTDFCFGPRFHVNMASLQAGVPALWLTHDSRTLELTAQLNLPNLDLQRASTMPLEEIIDAVDFEPFFDNLPSLYENFNGFLRVFGLPEVSLKGFKG